MAILVRKQNEIFLIKESSNCKGWMLSVCSRSESSQQSTKSYSKAFLAGDNVGSKWTRIQRRSRTCSAQWKKTREGKVRASVINESRKHRRDVTNVLFSSSPRTIFNLRSWTRIFSGRRSFGGHSRRIPGGGRKCGILIRATKGKWNVRRKHFSGAGSLDAYGKGSN